MENKNIFTEYNSIHRLNGYDNNILQQKAYMELDDTSLKIAYQIDEKEEILKNLKEKIASASDVEPLQNILDLKMQEKNWKTKLLN